LIRLPFWHSDEGNIAHWGDCFRCHGSDALSCPFVVLFEQEGYDEPDDGGLIGEDADDIDKNPLAVYSWSTINT